MFASRQAASSESDKSKPLLPKVTSLSIGVMNLDSTDVLLKLCAQPT